MANPKEKLVDTLKKSEMGDTAASGGTVKAETSVSFLQLFLKRIKFFAIAKREHPDLKLDVPKMKDLDAKLNSSDKNVQAQAFMEVDILFNINEDAMSKADSTPLDQIVEKATLSDSAKADLKLVTSRIETALASTTPKSEAELESVFTDLNTLREGLGERNLGAKENAIGFEYLDNKIKQLHARKELVEYRSESGAGEFRSDPIDKYGDQFGVIPKNTDLIQVRVGWNPGLKSRVEKFRKNVREELLAPDKERKLKDLTGEEALNRIKEVGELKAHIHELHGEKWVKNNSAEKMDEIRRALDTIQGEYQAELAKKIEERLKKQGNGDVLRHVPTALDKAIEAHRAPGRSVYKFEGGDSFDKLTQEALVEAQKMKKETPVARTVAKRHDPEDMPSMSEEEEYAEGARLYGRQKELQEKINKFKVALAGIDYKLDTPEFMRDIGEEGGIDRIIQDMRAHGLRSGSEADVREGLEGFRAGLNRTEGGMSMKAELEGLLAGKKYSEAINLTMEYLARVGLKEASSDWQLAITLRMQKDIISRINSDAAEAFEGRQHLLFLPNPNGLSHEKFGEVMAQVLTKSNMDYVLSPNNAFMLGTEVEIGGKRLNINTAMFKDLLRSEAASMRLLNADVNTRDSTLRGILAEHIWGKGTKLIEMGRKVKLANGETIDLMAKDGAIMRFYDIDTNSGDHYGKLMEDGKKVSLYEVFERTNWMMSDAQQFWWYGREWEKHLVNYPKNKMRNAPKKIASMGRMLSAYNGEFEKYDRSMADLALLGTLLQPAEAYKLHTTVGANVKDILIEKYKKDGLWGTTVNGVTYDAKRAKSIGELMMKLVADRVTIDGEEFVVDTLSQEAVRLVGNEINTQSIDGFYAILKDRYLGMEMKEDEIPSLEQMRTYYDQWRNTKDKTTIADEKLRFWGAQAEEMAAWIDLRKFSDADKGLISSITAAELKPFLEREAQVFGRLRTATTLREFFQGTDNGKTAFEFAAIMDSKKLDQGDDTFQYGANYYARALKAAEMLVKYFNLESSTEEVLEMFGTMQGYVPADVLRKYMTVAERRFLRAQSIQSTPFEVAHEAGKWVESENGKKIWVKTDSPNAIDYVTLTDKNGDKWQAKGRYGERVYVKEMTKRFHSFAYDQKGKWILRESDIDMRLSTLNARGYINREKKDDMLASISGMGQGVDKFLKRLGIDTTKGGGRRTKLIVTKLLGLIKKHPLFDDPVWAFWSISNTMWEYVKEVGKEMTKEVAK